MKKAFIFLLVLNIKTGICGQVNLQTGSSNFSLPMFNWQDDNSRLNSVVALNYSSGNGLKVNEIASNVGQGWRLITGGVVTRIQAGEPDDQKPREGTPEDETKYPAGYLYDPADASLGCPGALIKYPVYEDKNHIYKQHNQVIADKEQDRFSFQFNGKSGLFILGKNNGDNGILIGDSKIKVWFTRDEAMTYNGQGIRTTITAFYIQDESGLIYKFTQHELTKVLKTNYSDGSGALTQPDFKGDNVYHESSFDNTGIANPYTINSWYLAEIEDALTHRKVTFNYSNRSINADAGTLITYYGEKNYCVIAHSKSITETPEISSINYPDDHQVVFNYGDARIDLSGGLALASVDITYQSRNIAKYQLTTSYFVLNRYGVPVSDYQKKAARLCLLSVKKIGVDLKADDAPYFFDYNTGSSNQDDIVPPPFFHLKDIWGYYNGDYSHDYDNAAISLTASLSELSNKQLIGLCFMRNGSSSLVLNSKPAYAANGLLKKITYPTGGTLSYNYAQNTAVLAGQNTIVGGVHVTQTSVTDGGYSNDCINPVVTNYNYSADASNTQSSLWGVEMPVNSIMNVNHYAPELKQYHWGIRHGCFPFGCCKYKYQYPGILSREQAISLTSQQQTLQTVSDILDVVGAISQIMDIVTIIGGASGVGAIAALVVDIIGDLVNIVITCFADFSKDYYSTAFYNYDINSINPLPSEFKRVEVSESSGQNGKTVSEFTSPDDYAIWAPTNPALSSKQRFAYWAYGLPKRTTVYDAVGNPVKQTENVYDTTHAKYDFTVLSKYGIPSGGYPSCKCLVTKTYSQRNTDWEDPAKYNAPYTAYIGQSNADLKVDKYFAVTGRMELKASYERTYKPGNPSQYLETVNTYSYNLNNYQVNQITTNESNGNTKEKDIKYNIDFYDPAALNVLAQNNIVATPVETIVKENNVVTDETVTEFTTTANGDIKPYRTLKRNFNVPYSGGQFYSGPGSSSNPVDLKETQKLTYDVTGRLVGMKDDGDRMVTNIYDYNDKYVIASVINADASLDNCAYTSFETQKLSGWVLIGTAAYVNNIAISGNSSFVISAANSLTAQLNTAKAYRLSFWSTSSSVIITGNATLVKSAPLINGFTYYEYNIAQGTSVVTVSGNGTIDELRLYPSTSRMRTVTYDPVIGKTSECDENNRITYYEYDEHGRLRFIKDDTRNIVKMYEYNLATKKQTGPCVTSYYNKAILETFTKNNCGAGYVGSKVTYTIPANKYSSTINQAVVDMKAQDEAKANGQAYANKPGNALCILDTEPDWIGTGETQCQMALNINTGLYENHMFYNVRDQNPNSVTYNQTQWTDGGLNPACVNTASCSFTMNSGFSSPTNSISNSGGIVSFYLVFYSSTTMMPGNSYYIANISGGCKPSGVRTINYTSSGRSWTITIYPSGVVEAFLSYDSPSVNPYVTIGFTSLSFNL